MNSKIVGRLIAFAVVLATAGFSAGAERHDGAVAACKVKLGKNGGTGGDDYVMATIGRPMPTPCTAPKRTGWTFDGYWDTLKVDAAGKPKGKQYYDAKMKSVRVWDRKGTTTLWARWKSNLSLGAIKWDWTFVAWFAIFLLTLMAVAELTCRIWKGGCEKAKSIHPLAISDATSNKLRNLGFVFAVLVVLMHASIGFHVPDLGMLAGSLYTSAKRIWSIAVPVFLLISGYFLVGHSDRPDWFQSAMSKRLKSLLVPFILWSLLWIAYLFFRTVVSNAINSYPIDCGLRPWMEKSSYLGLNPVEHPLLGPLWYVRTLLFFVAVSPVLLWMLARCKWFVLACSFLVCAFRPENTQCFGNISYTFIYVFGFGYVFYFLVGMSLRLGLIKMPGRVCMICMGLCGIALLCVYNVVPVFNFKDEIVIQRVLCTINFPFLLCILWMAVPQRRWPMWLTSMSFPIYLVHWFVMDLHTQLFFGRFDTFGQLLFKFAWMLLVSMGIVAVMRLLPKKVYEVLFGGR